MLEKNIEVLKLKMVIVYILTTLVFFSAIYFIIESFISKSTTIEVTMRQTQTQNVLIHYEMETYNSKDFSKANNVEASENFSNLCICNWGR